MKQILELEETDDIASIKSRIDFAFPPGPQSARTGTNKGRGRLLLVVPQKNKALQSLVNMKLLVRVAKKKAVKIAIVSDHPTARDYAKEAGVKAFGNLKSAKRAGWVEEKAAIAAPSETLPPNKTAPPTEPPKKRAKKKKKYKVVQGEGRFTLVHQIGAVLLLVIMALVLVLGVIALLPKATVVLTPVAKPVETSLVVKADPEADSIDFETLSFPARTAQVDLEVHGEIKTVETELAPSGHSSGFVTFINRTDELQIIPISTTVTTSAGELVRFQTVITTAIPPRVDAATSTLVIATEPGPRGNVRTSQLNRFENPYYGVVARVINERPLGGGALEPARIVVNDDKERLQAHLRQLILQEGFEQLQASLGEQEFISPETLRVIVLDITYDQFSGDFSDIFSGEMQAVVRGTVVGGYNANRLALAALETQVPAGYTLDIEGLHFGAGEVLNVENQVVTFKIFAKGQAVREVNPHQIASDIIGLPIGEAQAHLKQEYDLASVPGIELSPDWLVEWFGRLPYLSLRIDVVVNDSVVLVADGGE